MMKVSALQITSRLDYKENLHTIRRLMNQAKEEGSEAIFLPECFYSMSNGEAATPHTPHSSSGQRENDVHWQNIRQLAVDFQVYLIGGSAATRGPQGEIYNRSYNFNPQGEDLGTYDKIHLFACDVENVNLNEGRVYTAGNTPQLVSMNDWKVGLGICFDLRFPEMFRQYTRQGAEILSIPAAFTVPTGKAHWHTLLRARAIENQCYVVAAAQVGQHNEKIQTFGHALIIDPWGTILADGGDSGEKVITASLSKDFLRQVRKRMIIF